MGSLRFSLLAGALVSAALAGLGAFGLVMAQQPAPPAEPVERGGDDPIAGLWSRYPAARADGDPVRFYFFHPSGIGLYRWGKVGLNHTQSFDWRRDRDTLILTFRKSGAVARTAFAMRGADGARTLMLDEDPKEPLVHTVTYTFVPPSDAADAIPDLTALAHDDTAVRAGRGVGGRLWIDLVTYATGGSAFSLYQLRAAAIDGRGVGWHHIGDFDDWSTEALAYRDMGAALALSFNLRGETATTPLVREEKSVTFVEDPRSGWHVRRYRDGGPSFGSAQALTLVLEALRQR